MQQANRQAGQGGQMPIVQAQITFLISTLSEETAVKNEGEIAQLIVQHGPEAHTHLLRRLLFTAAPVLKVPPPAPSAGSPLPQPVLALRLLVRELKRAAGDPTQSVRVRDALHANIIDTTTGPGVNESGRAFPLAALLQRAELSDLERLVILSQSVRTVAAPQNRGREVGLVALRLLRAALPRAIDQLRAGPVQGGLAGLGPMQFSQLLASGSVLGDWAVHPLTGEVGVGETGGRELPLHVEAQRELVRAVAARLGHPDQAASVVVHALDAIDFDPQMQAAEMLFRVCPEQKMCTHELIGSVFDKAGANPMSVVNALVDNLADSATKSAAISSTFQMLVTIASTRSDNETFGIDSATLVAHVKDLHPDLSWPDIIRGWDSATADPLPERQGVLFFASLLLSAPTAIPGLWGTWVNPSRQLGLIERLLSLPADTFNPCSLAVPGRRVVTSGDVAMASQPIKTIASSLQTQVWNSFDLVDTLIRLSDSAPGPDGSLSPRVRDVLDRAGKTSPDLLLVGLMMIKKPWNAMHSEACSRLLQVFLAGHASHSLVFYRLWQLDRSFLLATLRDWYAMSPLNITRIVDIAIEVKILEQVLDMRPFDLALDTASLANRRDLVNLDKWLSTAIPANGQPFVRAVIEFIQRKVASEMARNEMDPMPEPSSLPLPATVIASYLRGLRYHGHDFFTPEDVDLYREVRMLCLQLHPRLMSFVPGGGGPEQEPGMAVYSFTPEIEAEADAAYRQLYDGEMTVEDIVRMLQRAKEGGAADAHGRQLFASMCCTLFEEKRFFSTYPVKEMTLTAYLFGSLIQHNLVEGVPLSIAVRYVLDALHCPPESNWFLFGVKALSRFSGRLSEWPQLAQAILRIETLQVAHPEVIGWARSALSGGASGGGAGEDAAEAAAALAHAEVPSRTAFPAMHVTPLSDDEAEMVTPERSVSEPILFIINNLVASNLDSKAAELADRIRPELARWLANYLVAQRVSLEPNNHTLYLGLLDALKQPALSRFVLHETYVKVATLLNSDKTVSSSTERTLLKNLGAWLGAITLARNKPIRHTNIAFKDLLIQGHDAKRLIVAIPFVCKVLEQAARSRVFRPPNPWLVGILRLLVELYVAADIKLNLKFEIEVLCKSLGVDLKDIEPTTTLRDRPASHDLSLGGHGSSLVVQDLERMSLAPGGGFGAPSSSASMAPQSLVQPPSAAQQAQQAAADTSPANRTLPPAMQPLQLNGAQGNFGVGLQESIAAALQPLASYIVFPPQFAGNPTLKRIVHIAIDRAVREIIAPVVERSVTIAGISTRELALKDFCMEADDTRLATAAHLMVQNLAGSLALVTCKDPLRMSMITHMRTVLLQNGFTEANLPEQAIVLIASDNLELACSVVEKVAMDKATVEVDDALAAAYAQRRKHRDSRSAGAFWDPSALTVSHYASLLPDPLRIQLGGLQPDQVRVYDEFGRPRVAPLAPPPATTPGFDLQRLIQRTGTPIAGGPASVPGSPSVEAAAAGGKDGAEVMERFNALAAEMERLLALEASTHTSLGQLPTSSRIHALTTQLPLVIMRATNKYATALAASQRIVQLLFRSETALAREVHASLLTKLCSLESQVQREVTDWLLFADDERKFNVPVTVALLQHHVLDLAALDAQLAKTVLARSMRPTAVAFAAQLVYTCLFATDPPVATREALGQTLDALVQAVRANRGNEAVSALFDELRRTGQLGALTARSQRETDEAELQDRLAVYFSEWVRIFQNSAQVEHAFVEYVHQLQRHGILKGEEISSLFFRVCLESSVETYSRLLAAGHSGASLFVPIDAFARFLGCMIKYHADPSDQRSDHGKTHYVSKVLSIVTLVLVNQHETKGPAFAQKPFFRFFSSLLANVASMDQHLGPAYPRILLAIGDTLSGLQPSYFPGFAFSWVALISHRLLMPRLLEMKDSDGQAAFCRLFVQLLRFMSPFLRSKGLGDTTRALLAGLMRIMLVLLHDYPEFLATHSGPLIDAIPPSCIQLQNLVLSAFPASIPRLPDPFAEDAADHKDSLAPPPVAADYAAALQPPELRAAVDKVLAGRVGAGSLAGIATRCLLPVPDKGAGVAEMRYNWPLLTALVLHLCVSATGGAEGGANAVNAATAVYERVLSDLDVEGQYYFISATATLLRYPNAHTRWAKTMLLHCFNATELGCREVITRVVLERLIVARPQPNGLLMCASDLFKSSNLQEEPFVKKNPDIAALVTRITISLKPASAMAV